MQSYLGEGWAICRVVLKKAEQYAELPERKLEDNMQSYLEEDWTISRVICEKAAHCAEVSRGKPYTAQSYPGEI
jgi:hypothetical protein